MTGHRCLFQGHGSAMQYSLNTWIKDFGKSLPAPGSDKSRDSDDVYDHACFSSETVAGEATATNIMGRPAIVSVTLA